MPDVAFGSLSKWQKTDCINNSSENTCTNLAIQEAYISEKNHYIGIRCCSEAACMARATVLAKAAAKGSDRSSDPPVC
jgi:hypothetical protein